MIKNEFTLLQALKGKSCLEDGLSIGGTTGRQMSLLGNSSLDNQPINVNLAKYAFINIKGSNCVFKICHITSNIIQFLNRVSELLKIYTCSKIALLHFFQFNNRYSKLEKHKQKGRADLTKEILFPHAFITGLFK